MVRIVAYGWDRNSFSKHTTHLAGTFFIDSFPICQHLLISLFSFARSTLQHIDSEAVEIGVNCPALSNRPARSNPMQTPSIPIGRGVVPVLIESGSAST